MRVDCFEIINSLIQLGEQSSHSANRDESKSFGTKRAIEGHIREEEEEPSGCMSFLIWDVKKVRSLFWLLCRSLKCIP